MVAIIVFSSQTKNKIIKLLYSSPNQAFHMRQIERLVKERINSVREALLSLNRASFINREKIGRKILFQANQNCLFYDEVLRMVAKQTGLGERIIKEKLRLGKIKAAFLTGNFYQKQERVGEEIDLFVVGTISVPELAKITMEEGKRLGIEINYSAMTYEEFSFRQKNKDPFLSNIMQKNRLLLLGKEEFLR